MQATKNTLFQSGRIQLIFFIKGPGVFISEIGRAHV